MSNKKAWNQFKLLLETKVIDDRREYDAEDLKSAYPDLTVAEAEELEEIIYKYFYERDKLKRNLKKRLGV
jgi:hypothetical protein